MEKLAFTENISDKNIGSYFKYLVNKTYKILPLKEEAINKKSNDSYFLYLDRLMAELSGFQFLFGIIDSEPKMMDYFNIIAYLRWDDKYTHRECKSEVFKAIRILNDISNKNGW